MPGSNLKGIYTGTATANAALAICLLVFALSAKGDVIYKWVQLVPKGELGAQAVIKTIVNASDDCAVVTIGNDEVTLEETGRSKPDAGFESIKLCESFLDSRLTDRFSKAKFPDEKNTLTVPDLSKGVPLTEMIGFGCTGCRGGGRQGKCTREDWPFGQINTHGANHTSNELPPLVVHLGDVRYATRKDLPDFWTKENVEGALAGWKEEYFDVAKPLLDKGMWINMRGNHEACSPAGREDEGWMVKKKASIVKNTGSAWFYFFGYDEKVSCKSVRKEGDMVGPFVFDARSYEGTFDNAQWGDQLVRMVVLDTVRTGDSRDNDAEETKKKYTNVFDDVEKRFMHGDTPLWILSHIPIYSMNGDKFKSTVVLDALNDSKLNEQLSKVKMAVAAHRHEALLVNPNMGNPATEGPIQYVAGHGGVALSGNSRTQLACDLANVGWTPIGKDEDDVESETTWAVLRRPNWGYVKANFRGGNSRFSMQFYSLKQDKWYGDATVNCSSDVKGQFLCPYLPRGNPIKCP